MKRLCLPVIGPVIAETHEDAVLQENGTDTPVTILGSLEDGYDFDDFDSENRVIWRRIARSAQECRGRLSDLDAIDLLIDTPGGIEWYNIAVCETVTRLKPESQGGVSSFVGAHAQSLGCNLALFYAKRCIVAPYSSLTFHFGLYKDSPTHSREVSRQARENAAKNSMLYLRWLVYVLMDPTTGAVYSPLRNRLRETMYRRESTLAEDERWCTANIRGDTQIPDVSCDPQDFNSLGEFHMTGPELADATKHVTLVHSLDEYERAYMEITGRPVDRRNRESRTALFFRLQDLHFRAHVQGIAPPLVVGDEFHFAHRDAIPACALVAQWTRDYEDSP